MATGILTMYFGSFSSLFRFFALRSARVIGVVQCHMMIDVSKYRFFVWDVVSIFAFAVVRLIFVLFGLASFWFV